MSLHIPLYTNRAQEGLSDHLLFQQDYGLCKNLVYNAENCAHSFTPPCSVLLTAEGGALFTRETVPIMKSCACFVRCVQRASARALTLILPLKRTLFL